MGKDSEWDRKHKLFDPWTPLGEVKSTRMLTMLMMIIMMMIWEVIYNSYDEVIDLKPDRLRMLRSRGKAAGQTHTSKTDHVQSRHTPETLQTLRAKWERKKRTGVGEKDKKHEGSVWMGSVVALQSSLTDTTRCTSRKHTQLLVVLVCPVYWWGFLSRIVSFANEEEMKQVKRRQDDSLLLSVF